MHVHYGLPHDLFVLESFIVLLSLANLNTVEQLSWQVLAILRFLRSRVALYIISYPDKVSFQNPEI